MCKTMTTLRILVMLAAANLMLVLGTAPLIAAPAKQAGPPPDLPSAPLTSTAVAPRAASGWSRFTSEENPPLTISNGQLISAMRCTGRYCDNISLGYQNVPGVNHISHSWTPYFSEEGTNYRVCSGNSFMTGINCRGSYCDNISLRCTVVRGKIRGAACNWTPWFSEEAEYSPYLGGPDYYAAGLACRGSYCDDMSILACQAR